MATKHIFLAILLSILWGFNFVVMKLGLKDISPFLFGGLRFFWVSIPLVFFISPPKTSWKIIISIGLIFCFVKFSLMFFGLKMGASTGASAIILQSQMLFTVLLSTLFLKTKISFYHILGITISAIGMAVIAHSLGCSSTFLGFFFILTAAFSWGIANILIKKAGNVSPISLVVWPSLFSIIPYMLAAFIFEGSDNILSSFNNFSLLTASCLFYNVIVASLLGSSIWGYLIKSYNPAIIAPYSLLTPLFGMFFCFLILGETLSSTSLIGCGAVLLGLIINQKANFSRKVSPSHSAIKIDTPQKAA